MKNIKRLAALILVLVLALSLGACGKKPESELYGGWTYNFDMAEAIGKELEDQLGETVSVDAELVLPISFTFNKDNTFTLELQGDSMKQDFRAYVEVLTAYVTELVYSQAEELEMSREDFDAAFQEVYGATVEEYCGEMMSDLLADDFLADLSSKDEGVYKVNEGKLFVAETKDGFEEDVYLNYTVEDGRLNITAVSGGALDMDALDLEFPMVFEKES